MQKSYKKGVSFKAKSIIGMFSVLGMMVVGLGMLSLTQRAGQGSTDNQTQAASYLPCQQQQLTQMYYRGNQGWVRNVPIVGGKEQWSQGEAFRMFVDLNANPTAHPGSGEVRDINIGFFKRGKEFDFQMVRGDVAYYRYGQTSATGSIDWNAGNWQIYGTGYSGWQAFGELALRTPEVQSARKTLYFRSMYVDNKAYISDGYQSYKNGVVHESNNDHAVVKANKTFVFDLNTNPTAIPGSGPVQAIGDYLSYDETVLNQVWYRGNVGYVRQVPMRDYKPDYSSATPIQAAVDLNKNPNALPGSGDMQATANVISCKE